VLGVRLGLLKPATPALLSLGSAIITLHIHTFLVPLLFHFRFINRNYSTTLIYSILATSRCFNCPDDNKTVLRTFFFSTLRYLQANLGATNLKGLEPIKSFWAAYL
jgi:hypothetical protein